MRALLAFAVSIAMTLTASANDGFSVVIPGRPGVPIMINGVDASYAVIESDWGLARGIHMQPTVYGGRYIDREPRVGHYYPSAGHRPGYGRLEIEPPANRKLPRPAESFHQSWGAQSAPPAPAEVPLYPPMVLQAPRDMGVPHPRPRYDARPQP
ncbi:MAG: hypothetical protein BGP05_05550 [Rhizobiales bacterium 62-47]|nr:hypothetical protein [Hyphomicrobiales bacterium]OJY08344.1 MAG: hypothetical protein BGP05_05550 [Rhizobiales bacterium 62-47]